MVTLEECRTATVFYHVTLRNADGTALRCRANGRLKTWKTRPGRFRLPVKYGLKQCFYITNDNAQEWTVTEGESLAQQEARERKEGRR